MVALVARMRSGRVRGRLDDLRQQLRRWAHVPTVADFLEQTRQAGD
jgi:hypothetical protein